jgi:hypothetical protein
VSRGQRGGSLRPYSRFSRPEPLLVLPSSSSVVLTRLGGPRSICCTGEEITDELRTANAHYNRKDKVNRSVHENNIKKDTIRFEFKDVD